MNLPKYNPLNKYVFLLLLGFALSGCKKFLDVTPKGKFIPQYIRDYEELSSNPSYATSSNTLLELLADNTYLSDEMISGSLTQKTTKAYQWNEELFIPTETDDGWNPMYNNIFNANIIIQGVEKLSDGTETQRKEILGDAYFNRAYAYWCLVNTYAKDYEAGSAATDLGVPLILIPDLGAKPSRATVAAVYDQMLKDLLLAKDQLPDEAQNVYRNDKKGAIALLARVYQSMDNYPEAKKYANMALQLKNTLFDYNKLRFKDPANPAAGGVINRPIIRLDPEMISYKEPLSFSDILIRINISPDFLALLREKDLRYVYNWTRLDQDGKPITQPYPMYIGPNLNYNIGVAEMMLISAEAEARAGQIQPVLTLLNKLRKKRFKAADYSDLTARNADEALKLVIDERRRELFGKGLRWFDMRRLDNDSRFRMTYKRANTITIYQLEAGSMIFVQQIPPKVLALNPNIIPNPR